MRFQRRPVPDIEHVEEILGGVGTNHIRSITHSPWTATDSLTQGGVDSFSGFVVQALIVVLAGLFGKLDLIPEDASADVDWVMLLVIVLIALVISVVIWRRVSAIQEEVLPLDRLDDLFDLDTGCVAPINGGEQ